MKKKFIPITRECYIDYHLQLNPREGRQKISNALMEALKLYKHGVVCSQCGRPLWVIGSAIKGRPACFTCITQEPEPTGDYELVEACEEEDCLKSTVTESSIRVSETIPDDKWDEVSELSETVNGIKRSSQQWKQLFEKSPLKVFVWEKGRMIGFGRTFGNQQLSIVMDVFVHPDHQRKDLGKFITQFLLERGRELSWIVGTSAVSDEEYNYEIGRIIHMLEQRNEHRQQEIIADTSSIGSDSAGIMDMLIAILTELSHEKEWVPYSNVSQALINKGIDIKKYGYSKFKELVLASERQQIVETKQEKKTWCMRKR